MHFSRSEQQDGQHGVSCPTGYNRTRNQWEELGRAWKESATSPSARVGKRAMHAGKRAKSAACASAQSILRAVHAARISKRAMHGGMKRKLHACERSLHATCLAELHDQLPVRTQHTHNDQVHNRSCVHAARISKRSMHAVMKRKLHACDRSLHATCLAELHDQPPVRTQHTHNDQRGVLRERRAPCNDLGATTLALARGPLDRLLRRARQPQ